jgi:hypothetical protein
MTPQHPQQEPAPSPIDVARQGAQASIQQLIEADQTRLLQLKGELEAAEQEYQTSSREYKQTQEALKAAQAAEAKRLASWTEYNKLLGEVRSLEVVIGDRKQLAKKVSGVKVKRERESTSCVL